MQSNDPLVRLDDAVHPGEGEETSEQDVESLRGAYRDFNAGKPDTDYRSAAKAARDRGMNRLGERLNEAAKA